MGNNTCSAKGCNRPHLARSWCNGHYARWRAHGHIRENLPLARRLPPALPGVGCSVADCAGPATGQGLCTAHYARMLRYGSPHGGGPSRARAGSWMGIACLVKDCDRPVRSKNLCAAHYGRLLVSGSAKEEVPLRVLPTRLDTCQVGGCDRSVKSRNYCSAHAGRVRATGEHGGAELKRPRRIPLDARCEVFDCPKQVKSKNLCSAHYSRLLRTGSAKPNEPIKRSIAPLGSPCATSGCKLPVVALGLCGRHHATETRRRIKADPARHELMKKYQREHKSKAYLRDPQGALGKKKEYQKAWRAANPEKAKLAAANKNRKRKAARSIPFTTAQLAERIRYWGSRCWICKGRYTAIDHVKPLSKGGWHMLANLRPICIVCNSRKGVRWPYVVA